MEREAAFFAFCFVCPRFYSFFCRLFFVVVVVVFLGGVFFLLLGRDVFIVNGVISR